MRRGDVSSYRGSGERQSVTGLRAFPMGAGSEGLGQSGSAFRLTNFPPETGPPCGLNLGPDVN